MFFFFVGRFSELPKKKKIELTVLFGTSIGFKSSNLCRKCPQETWRKRFDLVIDKGLLGPTATSDGSGARQLLEEYGRVLRSGR